MKKILLASTMVLGLVFGSLGMASVSNAAVSSVSAGSAQTITLPTNTATLTGNATASSGSAISSYHWSQTSGPVTASIASPNTVSTQVSGLTTAGVYVFNLTATDNTAPTGLTGFANATVNVNPVNTPAPTPKPIKAKLEINGNSSVNLSGQLVSNSAGVLTVKVWGITFTVNTANASIGNTTVSSYVVGDMIMVNGKIDANASIPTITARTVHDWTLESANKVKNHSNNGWWKSFLKGFNGKGHDKNDR